MILVSGEVRFAPGEIDRLREAMARNIAATRAEPGCDHYSYAVDVVDPDRLLVAEQWADAEAIEAHMAAPHMAEFMPTFAQARIEFVSINTYEGHYLRTLVGSAPAEAS